MIAAVPEDSPPEAFTIDPEFREQLIPLDPDALAQLTELVIAHGCRDALTVWTEQNILLDGHHRYTICRENEIDFRVQYISFDTREEASDWVDKNQLGRRNLPPAAASLVRGRIYERAKKADGRPEKRYQSDTVFGELEDAVHGLEPEPEPERTRERLAKELGVSGPTIARDAAFARAVDILEPLSPGFTQAVYSGDAPSRVETISLAKEAATNPEAVKEKLSNAQLLSSSKSNEWYTPREYVDAARDVLGGIDVDPASCERANFSVQAKTYYTEENDGLAKDWIGTVWLNPPYGGMAEDFVTQLIEQYESGKTTAAIVLINSQTHTTKWFQPLCQYVACWTNHRISFYSPAGEGSAPTAGSVFVYLGSEVEKFRQSFNRFGWVVKSIDAASVGANE